MHKVRKLNGIANEEDWLVDADDIVVTLLGIELHCEAAGIASSRLRRAGGGHDRREANEDRSLLTFRIQEISLRVLRLVAVGDEDSVSTYAASMHHALWGTFAIECLKLVDQMKVLQQDRSIFPGCERVLVISHRSACICRESFGLLLSVDEAS